jgi:hypothetical protein
MSGGAEIKVNIIKSKGSIITDVYEDEEKLQAVRDHYFDVVKTLGINPIPETPNHIFFRIQNDEDFDILPENKMITNYDQTFKEAGLSIPGKILILSVRVK